MALASAARLALAQQALAQQSDDGGVAPPPARGGQMLAAVALSAKMKIDLKKMERKRLQRVCRACGVCTGGRWHAQVRSRQMTPAAHPQERELALERELRESGRCPEASGVSLCTPTAVLSKVRGSVGALEAATKQLAPSLLARPGPPAELPPLATIRRSHSFPAVLSMARGRSASSRPASPGARRDALLLAMPLTRSSSDTAIVSAGLGAGCCVPSPPATHRPGGSPPRRTLSPRVADPVSGAEWQRGRSPAGPRGVAGVGGAGGAQRQSLLLRSKSLGREQHIVPSPPAVPPGATPRRTLRRTLSPCRLPDVKVPDFVAEWASALGGRANSVHSQRSAGRASLSGGQEDMGGESDVSDEEDIAQRSMYVSRPPA